MALASAAKSLSKTVASPGVLFDVVPRGALASVGTSTSLLGQALGFIGNANHDMSSYWAKSHVMSTFADFNEKIFEQELAPDTYQAFHMYYSQEDDAGLKDVCTTPMYHAAKAGQAASKKQHGAVLGMDVVNLLEPVKLQQARVVYGTSLSRAVSGLTEPTHMQIVARLVTRELPITCQPAQHKAHSGKRKAPAGSSKARVTRSSAAAAAPGTAGGAASTGVWRPVRDSASGHTYYWNDVSDRVSWDAPVTLGKVGDGTPFCPATAPASVQALPDDLGTTAGQYHKVESLVVWERETQPGGTWRIAGWMP